MERVIYCNLGGLPAYGDVFAYDVIGDCCEPGLYEGDVVLVSAEALADAHAGAYVVYTDARDGKSHCARVAGHDGAYWRIENNHGMRAGCMPDLVMGAAVGVVRGGETIALSLG